MGTRRRNSSEWASASATPCRESSPVASLCGVLGPADRVGLAVEDDVEGQAHRLLGREVAEGHRRHDAVQDAIGPLLPLVLAASHPLWLLGRRRTIPDAKRSGRSPEGVAGDGPEASAP